MTDKEFKFRANSDWTINYGGDGVTENGLAPSGDNIKVPKESAYIITSRCRRRVPTSSRST